MLEDKIIFNIINEIAHLHFIFFKQVVTVHLATKNLIVSISLGRILEFAIVSALLFIHLVKEVCFKDELCLLLQ